MGFCGHPHHGDCTQCCLTSLGFQQHPTLLHPLPRSLILQQSVASCILLPLPPTSSLLTSPLPQVEA